MFVEFPAPNIYPIYFILILSPTIKQSLKVQTKKNILTLYPRLHEDTWFL